MYAAHLLIPSVQFSPVQSEMNTNQCRTRTSRQNEYLGTKKRRDALSPPFPFPRLRSAENAAHPFPYFSLSQDSWRKLKKGNFDPPVIIALYHSPMHKSAFFPPDKAEGRSFVIFKSYNRQSSQLYPNKSLSRLISRRNFLLPKWCVW